MTDDETAPAGTARVALSPALSRLPRPSEQRLAVRVTKDGLRHVRNGHPWLWEQSVTSISHDAALGDLAVVFDDNRRFVAIGFYDPESPIRFRILHHGAPVMIDGAFWSAKITAAAERRHELAAGGVTTGYRIIHGENDGLPGLVVDRYGDVLVVKLDTAAWFPHLSDVVTALTGIVPSRSVVLRMSRTVDAPRGISDGDTIAGERVTAPVLFLEHGLTFEADVTGGQKTGHFLDQRDNRARVGSFADGTDVLDMFCCTGGFSVYAADGGARSVHSVDLSPQAIATAQRNMTRNASSSAVSPTHRVSVGDAFEAMTRSAAAKERYDIVVVDPPSFARRESDVRQALRAYGRLTTLAAPLLRRGGMLVQSSCSSRVTIDDFESVVLDSISGTSRQITSMERTTQAVDHPIGFAQGGYLKTVFLRLS